MARPDLAVIVAAQGTAAETAACVESLTRQTGLEPGQIEVIVVEGPQKTAMTALANRFAAAPVPVRFDQCGSTSLPRLHASGMLQTEADLIALTEGHCTFPPDWASTALSAHAGTSDIAIGGIVLPAADLGSLNTGLFFCDYAQFLPGLSERQTCDLPGNNIVFKRESLPLSSTLPEQGFWKTFHCQRLFQDGRSMHIQPNMQVFYNRRLGPLQIISRRYHHGRCFGGMRAANISSTKRAFLCLCGPLMPFLLMYRLCQRAWPREDYRMQFICSAPAAFLCIIAWVAGEWLGNLAGPGESCDTL